MFIEHQLYPECFTHCQLSINDHSAYDSVGWQFELHSANQIIFALRQPRLIAALAHASSVNCQVS